MWRTMRRLAEDPSNPGDLAAFLALVTVGVVLMAIVVYIGLASLIWWNKAKKTRTWGEFVFPYLSGWREWIWERGIAALTAVTLAVTLVHKAAVVDTVLAEPVIVADAGAPRPLEEAGRELMRMGQEGPARTLIALSLDSMLASHPWLRPQVTNWLVAACLGLLLVYLAVLITLRIKASPGIAQANSGSNPATDENPVGLKRLALIGLCLGLLLVSPLGALSADELVDSAAGELRRREEPDKRIVQAPCHCTPDSTLTARVAALESVRGEVQRSRAVVESLSVSVQTLAEQVTLVRESLSVALRRESAGGPGTAAPRDERGLLVVITSPGFEYFILSRAGTRIQRTERGSHSLAPGDYRVVIRRMKFDSTVTVASGQTTTVERQPRRIE